MAGSDESKYRIDPNITTKIMDSKGVNYGHAISKMFDTLGDIEVKKEESAQKQEDRLLARESTQLSIDNAKKDQEIKGISVQNIKDEIEDEKQFMNFAKSGQSVEDYTKGGNNFRTSKYFSLAKDFGDKEKQLLDADAATYNYAEATKRFYDPKTQTFDENGFYAHMDTKLKNGEINPKVYASVIDGVNKARKGGIYADTISQKDLLTEESKDALMESKYGVKVPKKTSSANDLALQKWLYELQKENMELSQTNGALEDVKIKYKAATGGEEMTKEQILAYKKKQETPFYEFGSNKNQKKEEQVAQTLDLKETVDELVNISDEELKSVIGFLSESWAGTQWKRATGQYTPRDRELIQKIGKLNAEEMHRLYGAALTGNEVDRAKTWNLDRDYTSDVDTFKANLKNFKDMADKAYKRNTYGVYLGDNVAYQAPKQQQQQQQQKAESQPNLVEHNSTKTKVITPDQAQSLGIKFK